MRANPRSAASHQARLLVAAAERMRGGPKIHAWPFVLCPRCWSMDHHEGIIVVEVWPRGREVMICRRCLFSIELKKE